MAQIDISFSIKLDNGKVIVKELYGEYFRVDSDLEIKPSIRMENRMESIIEDYLGDTENNNIKDTMVKKLFTSRKPKVSKERKTIKDLVIVMKECQEELTNILNSTSANLYNKEDYVYSYIDWFMKQRIYDTIGKEYDKEEIEKKKAETRKQIDIEVTKSVYKQLKKLENEVQDTTLSIILKKIKENKKVLNKSVTSVREEIIATAKLINYQLELERYPVDTSEIKKTILLGLEKIINSIDNKINKVKSKEYLEIEDAISSLGINKDEGLDFNNL